MCVSSTPVKTRTEQVKVIVFIPQVYSEYWNFVYAQSFTSRPSSASGYLHTCVSCWCSMRCICRKWNKLPVVTQANLEVIYICLAVCPMQTMHLTQSSSNGRSLTRSLWLHHSKLRNPILWVCILVSKVKCAEMQVVINCLWQNFMYRCDESS